MSFLQFLNGQVHIKFKGCHVTFFHFHSNVYSTLQHTVLPFDSRYSAASDLGLHCLVNYIAYIYLSLWHDDCSRILMTILFCFVLFV